MVILRCTNSTGKTSRLIFNPGGRKDAVLMKDEEVDDVFYDMSVNLARHNLEVTLRRTKEQCFQAAKQCALESLEGFKKMDAFVRKQYADEPKKMAEWDEIAQKYEFEGEDKG
ncbi:MAG TPA: hypothetical protein VFQ47_00325 [Nitrososphaera sp.]|nr:hypothetical protein [Nitrososphaera sp.]